MSKELYIKEVEKGIYLLDEAHEATGYLVIGEEKACMIDTMNGYNDLYKAAREITDKPLVVVNTHGHPDHIFGNIFFEEVYMHPEDWGMAESFMNRPDFVEECQKHGLKAPKVHPIQEGDIIELGGRTLEVYEIPGHTMGGILLLLKEERILFTGDSINHHLWMQLDGCLPLVEYVEKLDAVMHLEEKADRILHGHAQDFDSISLIRSLRNGIVEICEGKTENDKPYNWFGGVARQHAFDGEGSVICYQEENIR